jgi:class 3 adenylate cyclase
VYGRVLHGGVLLGLHVGEVFYGNVGSLGRLDFTVVDRCLLVAFRN